MALSNVAGSRWIATVLVHIDGAKHAHNDRNAFAAGGHSRMPHLMK